MKPLLITIDGPAGSGKTTASKILAERLGYNYVDTGALYRGVAFEAKTQSVNPDNGDSLEKLCRRLDIKFIRNENGLRLLSFGKDISDQIRTPEITMLASTVSAKPVVRKFLLKLQQELAKRKKAVFEGRDMGTVVFPDADIKFFLDASHDVRAQRRFDEMPSKNSQSLENVKRDIQKRDANDRSRKHSPLKPADDAIIIDSSNVTIQEVVEIMLTHIKSIV